MPQIIVLKPFAFAHRGVQLQEFQPHAEPQEVAQEVVDHAGLVEEGYIEIVGAAQTPTPAPAPGQQTEPPAPAPAPVEPPPAPAAPAPAPARKTAAKKA